MTTPPIDVDAVAAFARSRCDEQAMTVMLWGHDMRALLTERDALKREVAELRAVAYELNQHQQQEMVRLVSERDTARAEARREAIEECARALEGVQLPHSAVVLRHLAAAPPPSAESKEETNG